MLGFRWRQPCLAVAGSKEWIGLFKNKDVCLSTAKEKEENVSN